MVRGRPFGSYIYEVPGKGKVPIQEYKKYQRALKREERRKMQQEQVIAPLPPVQQNAQEATQQANAQLNAEMQTKEV